MDIERTYMDIERRNMTITLTGTFMYTLLFTNCYITNSMKQNSLINYSLLYIYPYKQTSFSLYPCLYECYSVYLHIVLPVLFS